MALSTFLARRSLQMLRSPGDGHCLIHSVVSAWNSQLSSRDAISVESVKAELFIETVKNVDLYDPVMCGRLPLFRGLRRYIIDRHYNQDFGDIVPNILCF